MVRWRLSRVPHASGVNILMWLCTKAAEIASRLRDISNRGRQFLRQSCLSVKDKVNKNFIFSYLLVTFLPPMGLNFFFTMFGKFKTPKKTKHFFSGVLRYFAGNSIPSSRAANQIVSFATTTSTQETNTVATNNNTNNKKGNDKSNNWWGNLYKDFTTITTLAYCSPQFSEVAYMALNVNREPANSYGSLYSNSLQGMASSDNAKQIKKM